MVVLRDRVARPEAQVGPAREVTIATQQFEAVLDCDRSDVRLRDEPNRRLRGQEDSRMSRWRGPGSGIQALGRRARTARSKALTRPGAAAPMPAAEPRREQIPSCMPTAGLPERCRAAGPATNPASPHGRAPRSSWRRPGGSHRPGSTASSLVVLVVEDLFQAPQVRDQHPAGIERRQRVGGSGAAASRSRVASRPVRSSSFTSSRSRVPARDDGGRSPPLRRRRA